MDAGLLTVVVVVVWSGVLIARSSLLAGVLFSAAASIATSAIAERRGPDNSWLLGGGLWRTLAELIALGVLAAWATRRLPPVSLAAALVALAAAVVAMSEWRQHSSGDRIIITALLAGLGGTVVAGMLLRQSDSARTAAGVQARQDERLTIARELHDVVAHHVTGMVVQAQAGQVVAGAQPDGAVAALASIERAGSDALSAMRQVVRALRDDGPDVAPATTPQAPPASLADLTVLADHTTELGLPVRLQVDVEWPVAVAVAQSVHRIVGESLTNAHRHATGATTVDVRVQSHNGSLDVVITDDGRPRPSVANRGFGLIGMAERVKALGGSFAAGPATATTGWQVHATFPPAALRSPPAVQGR